MVDGGVGAAVVDLKNSIIFGNNATDATTRDIYLDRVGGGLLTLNASYSDLGPISNKPTDPANVTLGIGVISTDPNFVNPAAGDFHPSADSPVVDSGTAVGAPTHDLDGAIHPIGAGKDMGAFEIDAAPDAFSFTPKQGAPTESWIVSSFAVVSGVSVPVNVSTVSGEYAISVDGGSSWSAWTDAPGSAPSGAWIKLRLQSWVDFFSLRTATLHIGSQSAAFVVRTISGNLDINLDGSYDAASDGLIVLRCLFGFTTQPLVENLLGDNGSQRTDPTEIATYLGHLHSQLDVDGDTLVMAMTDGLLILRHLLGLRGDALVAGALGPGASRNADGISDYITALRP